MRFDLDDELDDEAPVDRRRRPRLGWVVAVAIPVALTVTALLHISTRGGGDARSATVPAVVGLSEAEARLAAEGAKLTLEVRERVHDPLVPRGAVAWQQPLAGARVTPGTPVQVKPSAGLPGAP